MFRSPFWSWLKRPSQVSKARRSRIVRDPARRRLFLEILEDRTLPSSGLSIDLPYTATVLPGYQPNDPPFSSEGTPPYGPATIANAYGINQIDGNGTVNGQPLGTGITIVLVDAYDDPELVNSTAANFASSDLATFDTLFGLPTPVFTKVNSNGQVINGITNAPPVDTVDPADHNWEGEEALDVEWAHAIAPGANIVLVEAQDPNNLFSSETDGSTTYQAAVQEASNLGQVVSMSFGSAEFNGEQPFDSLFTTPGVTYLESSGDSGSPGSYGAYSPNVVGVGGTALTVTNTGAYESETGWGDSSGASGGGMSEYEPIPAFQNGLVIHDGSNVITQTGRAEPDVAFEASADTGVLEVDSYLEGETGGEYWQSGGTSLACPCWAGLVAIADQIRATHGESPLSGSSQTLPTLYNLYNNATAYPNDFHDITTGSNTGYTAGPGYDLVTGIGTPIANNMVQDLAGAAVTTVTSSTANGTYSSGASVSIQMTFSGTDVTVTGTPELTLNDGGTAIYSSGSGTNTLSFTYIVGPTDTTNGGKLDYSNTSALNLDGGTITDAGGNAADLTLPDDGSGHSLSDKTDIIIDTTTPIVTSVFPNSGPTSGGTSVVISGSNLTGATQVNFGSTSTESFTVNGAGTSITINSPPESAGTVDVTVTTPYGTSATSSADKFTYVAVPIVTGISPNAGPLNGNTIVTISGSNLTGATQVSFGATTLSTANFTVNAGGTSITANSPAESAGTVDVTVTTIGGTSATSSADQFTYVAAPIVTGISTSSGPISGGTSVTISGSNFTGATQVSFGTKAISPVKFTINVGGTSITVTSPPESAGTVDVTVTTVGGTSATSSADQFTYVAVPIVTGITPSSGPTSGGTSMTISGSNFTGATQVSFGATALSSANFTVNGTGTSITVNSPPESAGTVDVTVTTAGGTSATSSADQFTYVVPVVTSVFPNTGPTSGGTSVTISGSNFTGATQVNFGATAISSANFTVNGAGTSITVTSPPESAAPVDVTVTTADGTSATSSADQFTYVAAPVVTSVFPNSGSTNGGTSLTISGSNFTGATQVSFGATALSSANFTVNGAGTSITVNSPPESASTVDVTVTTVGGTSTISSDDQFTYVAVPIVTGISPSSGPTSGGTSVTISGSNFTGATQVSFGATALSSANFTVNGTGTSITVNSPAETGGTVDVTVTTVGGTSVISSADQFTYVVPIVTSVFPNSGPVNGGTSVTINGSNFTGATQVSFGATALSSANFTVNGAGTSITVNSPPESAGIVNVTVTTVGGTSATSSADQFTYVAVPIVTGITPSSGPTSGGTSVTISGSNFTGATQVSFGATAISSANFTINAGGTSITVNSPVATAGTVDVTVTTVGGTSATSSADQFTYVAVPIVTGITPSSGPTSGGTSVTISGSNFTGATQVNFGATALSSANFTINAGGTSITVNSPVATAGTVDVTVTTVGGTSVTSSADQLTYVAAPIVTGITPNVGPLSGGTSVTINGSNFTGATQVSFGVTALSSANFTLNGAGTSITVNSPPESAGTVDVTVTTIGGTSATSSADQLTYVAAPIVTGITPTAGPLAGHTRVSISGSNFTGATQVSFGATAISSANFTVNGAGTSITVNSPPESAGTVDVTVTTIGGTSATSSADQLTYVAAPAVTGITPNLGPLAGGTSVTISGSNFAGATQVSFGATALSSASFTVNGAGTSITVNSPPESAGTVDVTVTTPYGTSATSSADKFAYTNAPTIVTDPSTTTSTVGQTVILTAAANGTPAPTVQWQLSSDGGQTWTNISGATSTSLTLSNLQSYQNGDEYQALFSNSAGTAVTTTAVLTVQFAPIVATNPSNQAVPVGASAVFTATASGDPTPTVQWQVSSDGGQHFSNINDATSMTLTLGSVTAALNGTEYQAIFDNGIGSTPSSSATLTVQQAPSLTMQPSSLTVMAGQTATFTAAASGNPTPTVQWQVSTDNGATFTNLSGATSTTLTLNNVQASQDGDLYQAVFLNSSGNLTSQTATLTVQFAPTIVTQPISQTIVVGQTATFTASADGDPMPSIQWQVSTDNGTTFTNISDATSPTLTLSDVQSSQNGDEYRAVFSNSLNTLTTNAATLNVLLAPVVTGNPSSLTVSSGGTATFTASANGNPAPTVQWQLSSDGGSTFTNISGANSPTLTLSNVQESQNGDFYQAVFSNGVAAAASSAALLTIPFTDTAPVVTTDPADETVVLGQTATFAASASGYPTPSVQWQVSNDGGNTFSNISGATGTTLTLTNVQTSQNGNEYRAVFSNGSGTISSSAATLLVQTVSNTAPVVTSNPSPQTVTAGQIVTFTASANGTPAATAQWQISSNGGMTWTDISGATSATLTINPVLFSQSGSEYRAVFTNALGSVTTSAVLLTVQQSPIITAQPLSQSVSLGGTVTFTASASGTPMPPVQWQLSTNNSMTFADILGATSPTLTLTNVQLTQNGYSYRALFSSNGVTAATSAATLTVLSSTTTALTVTTNPVSQTVAPGQTATFTAGATGTPAPTVQWQVSTDGGVTFSNISGAVSPILLLTNVQASQNGNAYRAIFTNSSGSVTTSVALLAVSATASAAAITSVASAVFTVGQSGSFVVTATGSPTPSLSVSGALPSGVTFVDNGNGTATLAGSPAAGSTGTYSVTITAHNGAGSDAVQSFTLTVKAASVTSSPPSASSSLTSASTSPALVLKTPYLLALIDQLLGAIETINDNGTETVTDYLFGTPLLVSTYDNSGNFLFVTLFGFDVTFLFL